MGKCCSSAYQKSGCKSNQLSGFGEERSEKQEKGVISQDEKLLQGESGHQIPPTLRHSCFVHWSAFLLEVDGILLSRVQSMCTLCLPILPLLWSRNDHKAAMISFSSGARSTSIAAGSLVCFGATAGYYQIHSYSTDAAPGTQVPCFFTNQCKVVACSRRPEIIFFSIVWPGFLQQHGPQLKRGRSRLGVRKSFPSGWRDSAAGWARKGCPQLNWEFLRLSQSPTSWEAPQQVQSYKLHVGRCSSTLPAWFSAIQ